MVVEAEEKALSRGVPIGSLLRIPSCESVEEEEVAFTEDVRWTRTRRNEEVVVLGFMKSDFEKI